MVGGRKLRQLCLPSGVRTLSLSLIQVQVTVVVIHVTCEDPLWNLGERNSQEPAGGSSPPWVRLHCALR